MKYFLIVFFILSFNFKLKTQIPIPTEITQLLQISAQTAQVIDGVWTTVEIGREAIEWTQKGYELAMQANDLMRNGVDFMKLTGLDKKLGVDPFYVEMSS